jgi:D-alanyl-D-alanine carboxypeptidase (penicillin-binding protein 5/6)
VLTRFPRWIAGLSVALAVAMGALGSPAIAATTPLPPFQEMRYAAVVVDAETGEVLFSRRGDSLRYPASITKVMTLYLTFEALSTGRLSPDDRVVISAKAAAQSPTKLGLPVGASLSVSEAMQALAIKSANDVSVALAEKLGEGSERRFAAMMTLRARELGMVNTHFVNASGLPDSRQVTTARDLAILSRAVLRDFPQHYAMFSQQSFTFQGRQMNNHNGLLWRMPGADGLKTGFTSASGYNLAVSAVRGNRRLIAVVLGGPSNARRNAKAENLLLTGFELAARRDRGERVQFAQASFESEPAPAVLYAQARPPESGADILAPDRVVLTSAPPPRNLSQFEIVDPASTGLRQGGRAAAGKWSVQVGAFRSQDLARKQAEVVRKLAPDHFSAGGRAEKSGASWRTRFTGYSESSARAACKALKARGQPCMVLPPSA